MIKKIIILISLPCLNNCVGVGFDMGLHYQETVEYKFKYNDEMYRLSVTSIRNNNKLDIIYNGNECGEYFLFGPIVPFIPIWENKDCNKNIIIGIYKAEEVRVKFDNIIYNPIKVQDGAYTFPISIKSLSSGAVLIVKKDGEKFEIPFRYQHTFSFDLFPGR
jgi:hypothetical protein